MGCLRGISLVAKKYFENCVDTITFVVDSSDCDSSDCDCSDCDGVDAINFVVLWLRLLCSDYNGVDAINFVVLWL